MKLVNAIREKLGTYAQSQPSYRASGVLWPNGEFSLGYAREGHEFGVSDEWAWTGGERGLSPDELDARLECLHGYLEAVAAVYSVSAKRALSELTLSNVSNSHRPAPPSKNGLKGMTGYGTKMLRSACHLLEQRLGRDDCVMVTLTVPTLPRESRAVLAQEWGEVVRQLVQYLSRRLVKSGRSPVVAGCCEIQTGRLEKYGQGYLHVHLVCPAHSNTGGAWAVDAQKLRSWWKGCLERTVGHTLPTLPRVETALVKKSVEGYLGKYLSKGTGAELEGFISDLGESAVPGQWWFMSASMRAAVKRNTLKGANTGAILDCFVNHLLEVGTGEGFEYIRHIDCDFNGRPVTVGWVGRLTPDLAREVRAMLSP